MTKLEKRCAHCGGKFGLIYHHHWGLRFCRKACKDDFLAKTAKDHARVRKWFGRAPSSKERSGLIGLTKLKMNAVSWLGDFDRASSLAGAVIKTGAAKGLQREDCS